jgi:hypothetical protein
MPSLEETRRILSECGEGVNWSEDEIQRFADRTSRHASVIVEAFAHHREAITREYRERKARKLEAYRATHGAAAAAELLARLARGDESAFAEIAPSAEERAAFFDTLASDRTSEVRRECRDTPSALKAAPRRLKGRAR